MPNKFQEYVYNCEICLNHFVLSLGFLVVFVYHSLHVHVKRFFVFSGSFSKTVSKKSYDVPWRYIGC